MNRKESRPGYADGELRTGVGVNRLRTDVFVLRILALPNVRAKRVTTAWRAGQQAQNGPQALRLMASVTRRWRSA